MKPIELIPVQLTYPELQSLPLPLRRRINRRWKRLQRQQAAEKRK